MKFRFNAGRGDSTKTDRPISPSLPPTRPPSGTAHPSSITGPVASATGGGTVLGATIPVVYGEARIKGFLGLAERVDNILTLMWVLCSGWCVAPTRNDTYINGELVDTIALRADSWITSFGGKGGTPGQSVSTILNPGLGVDYNFSYPGQVLWLMTVDTLKADMTSFNLEWDCGGRKFQDFRLVSPPSVAHKNNVLIAYDILTSTWPWPGVLTDDNIDLVQWEEWADWCDDTTVHKYDYATKTRDPVGVAIGQPRFEFNGIVKQTNPWDAANSVLSGAHLSLAKVDGKIRLRPETDVTPLGVYIPEGRFLGHVEINDADPNTIPTEMEVAFIAKEDHSECKITYQKPSAAGEHVKLASTLYGCNSQDQAIRWAEQAAKIYQERWTVKFVAGHEVANVAPGDIIEAYLPYGFGDSFIRVMSIIAKHDQGKYQISGRIVTDSIESTTSGLTYSPEDPNTGWETGNPHAPRNFAVVVESRKSSRDTYQPIIQATWDAPLAGPRVRFYELKQEATVIARVWGNKWSGPVMDTGSSVDFSVKGVGYDGSEGPTDTVLGVDLEKGYVAGIGGKPITDTPQDDNTYWLFDDDTFKPVKEPANYEHHTLVITAGTTASDTINSSVSDSVTVIGSPLTVLDDGTTYVAWKFGTSGFAVTLSKAQDPGTYPVEFSIWVSITPSADNYSGGGAGLPPGEET